MSNEVFWATCPFLPHPTSLGSPATLRKKGPFFSSPVLGIALLPVAKAIRIF